MKEFKISMFKKYFGQNFLRSKKYAKKLVESLNIEPGDVVVEIGPGEGIVTEEILKAEVKLISVEIDYSLIPNLIKHFGNENNFKLINQDILKTNIAEIVRKNWNTDTYKVIGSLPFNISKEIISLFFREYERSFLESDYPRPIRMSFILQEEVSKLYSSKTPKNSMLSALSSLVAKVKKLESIPFHQFYPPPKVNGAITLFEFNTSYNPSFSKVQKLIKTAFKSPRKTLFNNLKPFYTNLENVFEKLGLDTKVRASQIDINTWNKIAEMLIKKTNK